jgi:hypothetical protein
MKTRHMTRRKALEKTSMILGGALTSSLWAGVLNGCRASTELDWTPRFLTKKELKTMERVVDILIPPTDTPGAAEALAHRFIDEMLHGYFDSAEKEMVKEGIHELQQAGFEEMNSNERFDLMKKLSVTAQEEVGAVSFFTLVRSMTLLGYFTSEIGATQALAYDPIPGAYEGCIPLHKYGGKTWAEDS